MENSAQGEIVGVANGTVDEGLEDGVLKPKVEFFCGQKRGWMEGREGADRREVM